jgi:hypothetical protein
MYPAMSVHARQELFLKIGMAFSRLTTKAYGTCTVLGQGNIMFE